MSRKYTFVRVYTCANLAAIEGQKHPSPQAEVDLASPVAVLVSLSHNSLFAKASPQPGNVSIFFLDSVILMHVLHPAK